MDARLCYVVAASEDEARRIGSCLVEERLAASANVLGEVSSFFWWDGALNEAQEAALIVRTRQDLVAELTRRVRELHSYQCPCVVALPITGGNPDYLRWIEAETLAR